MSASPQQSKFLTGTGAGVNVVADQNVVAGNAIVVVAYDITQTTTFTIFDTQGNTYGLYLNVTGANNTEMAAWVAVAGTSGANTVTVRTTVGTDTLAVMAAEVAGCTPKFGGTNIPFNAGHISNPVNPGTGTDGIISTALATDSVFALALCMYETIPTTPALAAGTGFTSSAGGNIHVTGWSGVGFGANPALIEWKSGIPIGSNNATFTDASGGAANTYLCAVIELDEFNGVGDDLISNPPATDLVVYDNKWTYAQGTTNGIKSALSGAICAAGPNPQVAFWNTGGFTADQQSQCRINSFGNTGALGGVGVRISAGVSGFTGYAVWLDSGHYNIVAFNNGSGSSLSGLQALVTNVGDIINLTVRGSQLTFLKNGIAVRTVTDTTITSGSPGIAFNGQGANASTTIDTWRGGSLGTNLIGQTINTTLGQIQQVSKYSLTSSTLTTAEGALTPSLATVFPAFTISSTEGQIINVLQLTGQTASFTEGVITISASGNITQTLGAQSLQFAEGQLFDNISYVLDQGATVANLFGQTATFSQGVIALEVDIFPQSYTLTAAEGTPTTSISLSLGSLSLTAVEGIIAANTGTNFNKTLGAQTITTSEGVISLEADYFPTAQTITSTLGVISFSSNSFIIQLAGLTATFSEGQLNALLPGNEWVARESAMNAGLIPVVQYAEDPSVPPGFVITQAPPPGSVVPVNSPVTMVVSRGPYSPQGSVIMPNVIGLMWKAATDALAAGFLSEGYFVWQVNAAQPGSVISQSIPAGTSVPPGTIIQLTLSAGPAKVPGTVQVPTLH